MFFWTLKFVLGMRLCLWPLYIIEIWTNWSMSLSVFIISGDLSPFLLWSFGACSHRGSSLSQLASSCQDRWHFRLILNSRLSPSALEIAHKFFLLFQMWSSISSQRNLRALIGLGGRRGSAVLTLNLFLTLWALHVDLTKGLQSFFHS